MTTYLKFTEENDWEGETWHFYLPIEGNETALATLRAYLDQEKSKGQYDFPYTLGTEPITEAEVDAFVKHSDSGYMMEHNKIVGFLGDFDTDADPDDLFYKGRIDDHFKAVAQ